MKALIFVFCILSFVFISCNRQDNVLNERNISQEMNQPDSTIDLAGYRYGLYQDLWYTIVDGYKVDLVDTKHIMLRLFNDGDINNYDFGKIGLPRLNIVGVTTDIYYEVEIPDELNPFDTGKILWESDDFKELMFNLFISVD
ncbi:MAG: hypothetical protein JXR46_12305 [Calditrichaceae bacterium]|nr:hypothetical protein [Calditrichaceae bacterium]MBN2709819.1 hypothetical protein [Calditrichaceae bacterium]